MAYEYRDECLGCAVPSYPCRGASCPQRHIRVWICDMCGEEMYDDDDVYEYDGNDVCRDCLLNMARKDVNDVSF